MSKEPKIIYEPHPVTPERKAELRGQGYTIVDAVFAPGGHEAAPADSGDIDLPDDELRAAIEAATGKAPHHKAGRAKLLELYAALTVGEAE